MSQPSDVRGADLHHGRYLEEFRAFYERDARRLIRSVTVVVGEPALAEDAVAEAFSRAWLRWPQLRGGDGTPSAWIMRVALNECRGRFRRRRVEQRYAHAIARPDVSRDPDPPSAEVWDAVARLPERDRLLVALRYVADLTQDEIARTLGIASGTVASGLNRARRLLGVDLRDDYQELCDG